jgi:hypothetical protein
VFATAAEPLLSRIEVALSISELHLPIPQSLIGLLGQNRRAIDIGGNEHHEQLTIYQGCDGAAHRDAGRATVPLPGRPIRRCHGDPHHLETLVLTK